MDDKWEAHVWVDRGSRTARRLGLDDDHVDRWVRAAGPTAERAVANLDPLLHELFNRIPLEGGRDSGPDWNADISVGLEYRE